MANKNNIKSRKKEKRKKNVQQKMKRRSCRTAKKKELSWPQQQRTQLASKKKADRNKWRVQFKKVWVKMKKFGTEKIRQKLEKHKTWKFYNC